MPKAKEVKVKKYNFVGHNVCVECSKEQEIPGPCVKCGKDIFQRFIKCEEIK